MVQDCAGGSGEDRRLTPASGRRSVRRRPSIDSRRPGRVLSGTVVYRITARSNPRILIIYLFIPVILLAGIGALFLLGILYGLVALAAAVFLSWSLVRLTRRQLATRVETLTDEILFTLHGEEKHSFPWDKIRISGIATEQGADGTVRRKERRLFIYREEDDQLIAITDEFQNLDGLAAELRERTHFREILLAPGETLKGKLRELVGEP